MKATKVFIIFALALVSKLALVECLRNATLATDGKPDPLPYMVQLRSMQGGVRRNSTACIVNNRWSMAVADMVFQLPSNTFIYIGSLIFNGLGNVRSIIVIKIDRSLALLKTNSSIVYSDTVKPAPRPMLGQNYGMQRPTICSYGKRNNARDFDNRHCASGYLIDYNVNHPTTATADTMIVKKNQSISCVDWTDVGAPVYAGFNGTNNAVVALVLGAVGNLSCQANPTNSEFSAIRLTKYQSFINTTTADLS